MAKNDGKNLSGKYSQKLVDNIEKYAADSLETISKMAIQKTAEAAGDLIGNKISDNISSISSQDASKTNTTPQTEDVIPREV